MPPHDPGSLLSLTLFPLAKLFSIWVIGALLARLKILDARGVDALTRLVVYVLLPFLIFTKIVSQFRPGAPEYAGWWLMPLVAVGMIGIACAISLLPARWLCTSERRSAYIVAATFHNAGYFPLIILEGIYGQDPALGALRDRLMVLLFLYILGYSPWLWYVGVRFARSTVSPESTSAASSRPRWLRAITPPLIANLSAITLCLLGAPQSLQPRTLEALLAPLTMLADCTVPIIMLTLGAMLGSLNYKNRPAKREIASLVVLRLMLVPAVGFFVITAWGLPRGLPLAWAITLFVQTITPTATNIAVMVRRYGSGRASEFVNHSLLALYLCALITIPLWLSLWAVKVGFW
jgi:predicted permease